MVSRLKKILRNSLGFSRRETTGSILLIIIILLVAVIPRIMRQNAQTPPLFDSLALAKWDKEITAALVARPTTQPLLQAVFPFDPNVIGEHDLHRLGFKQNTIRNLLKYREAGGRFKIKNDLRKIFGISQDNLNRLSDYIKLPEMLPVDKQATSTQRSPIDTSVASVSLTPVYLNTVTAEELITIKGIGPVLSKRIVKYRELLGGFYSYDQLYEVYGLDSSVIHSLKEQFILKDGIVPTIHINSDSIHAIAAHPYIDWNLANSILNYRKNHGIYTDPIQLKNIKILSDTLFHKIYPYISLNP